MIRVKLSTPAPQIPLIKITPGSKGIVGNYEFRINDDMSEADWWVVMEGVSKKEKVTCPLENTLLISQETEFVKNYSQKFVNQFNWVLTSHRTMKHPRKIFSQQGYNSYLFLRRIQPGQTFTDFQNQFKTYDELGAMTTIPKSKLLSVVTSHKIRSPGAIARNHFINEMKKHFGNRIDAYCNRPGVFGPDTIVSKFKWDAVAPYKYHLAIENSNVPHYWTDKLLDAFLAGAFPIYYGSPNVFDYFPKGSLALIDIYDISGSIRTIEQVTSGNYFEKHKKELSEARRLVLQKYNIFQTIADTIDSLPSSKSKKLVTIRPEENWTLKIKQHLITGTNKVPGFRNVAKKFYRSYRAFRYGKTFDA